MRKIFFISIFLLVLNFSLKAQILQQPNTYGIGWKRTGADTLLYIPSDTLQVPSWGVGKTHISRKGTTLYYWDGTKWSAISGSGGTYTAGNGLTLSGSQFKLGGMLTDDTTLINQASKRLRFYGNETMFDSLRLTSAGEQDFTIRHRLVGLGFPVTTIKPTGNSSKNIAFDIMPTGTPGNYSDNGIAWIDVCDSDVSAGAVATATARIGITSSAVQFGSRAFGGASDKPVEFVVDTDTRMTLSTSNTATFNIGKITQSQSVSGDYVGYTLLNTNNSVAESNPIFFIGNDFASLRFGYLRWNNAATSSGLRLPNQLEIASNTAGGVNGGLLLGAWGESGKIRFATGTGAGVSNLAMIIDSTDRIGIGTSSPVSVLHTVGTVRHATLGTASTDTTTYKPLGIDTNGDLIPMSNWYGGGGGGSVSSASGTGVSLVNGSSLIKRLKEGTGITITDNTDSVTINRVSDSTMVRNLRWKYRNTLDYNEDYEAASFNRWAGSATGAGSIANDNSFTMPNWMLDYFGAVQNATGTTTTGSAISYYGAPSSGAGGTFRNENTKNLSFEVGKVLFPVLSDSTGGTDIYKAAFGLFDWWASDITQTGIQIVYDRASHGNYWAIRSDNGSVSTVVTTTPIEDSTRYTIRLEVSRWDLGNSGGSVRVYINDVEVVASSGTYPITTNIPYGTWQGNPFYLGMYIKKSAGTNSRIMYADWTHIYAETVDR